MRKITLIALVYFSMLMQAQHSVSIPENINYFKVGKECFDNQQYAASTHNFNSFLDEQADTYSDRVVEARYYILYAAYLQKKEGVAFEMVQFVKNNQGSYLANQMTFELGRYYFSEEDYRNTVKAFEPCKEDWLKADQLADYYYQFGYAYFKTKKLSAAKPLFKSVIDLDEDYYDEALYYYSFLQYSDENYNSALEGFEELHKENKFETSVPYYIAQIYFLQEEYVKLIDLAPELLSQKGRANEVELHRILGDAYYQLGDYDNAIAHLEAYQKGTKKILRQDLYHLGVAYYKQNDFAKAAETFAQITAQNDPLSQSAYSYLGECFVKLGEKDRACLAFGTASKYKFDPILREDAYYNYVKLSYETAVSPFSGTITLLEGFLSEFPKSEYTTEIYNLMYQSYMTTTNFSDACQSIQKIKTEDSRLVMARQRVMYYRGVELYNQGKYKQAITYFKRSAEGEPLEKNLKALALYWLGDANYQLERYEEAMSAFNVFISSNGAYSLSEFSMAHYNLGYCFFKLQNYNAAINWFRKYTQVAKSPDADLMTDAYCRVGDCFYLKRNFFDGIKYYSQAIEQGGAGLDYAYYQKGSCQGLSNQYEPKIVTLNILLNDYPTSPYADDALFEVARTWVILERYDEAIAAYKQLPTTYPNSKYASTALLNAGLAYYNNGELDLATESYKQVVNKYQGTEDARSAMSALKNISIDQNSVNDYIAYANEVGVGNVQEAEEDSLTFLAAEKLYIAQRYEEAVVAFDNYTQSFAKGVYVLVSYFYMADAHMQLSQAPQAMTCLEYIVKQPRSIYTEQSLTVLSATYFNEKEYSKALESYKQLLDNAEQKSNVLAAKIGVMECNYVLSEAGATILAVDNLLTETLSPAVVNKAYYYKAQSYLALGNQAAAKESFVILAQDVSNAYGAEAKYLVAKMHYDDQEMAEAKNEVLDFINKGTSEQYWLAKAFILLSDIFVVEDDLFQAKQYLLSISDNYKQEDDILNIVSGKLNRITLMEEAKNQEGRDTMGVHFASPTDTVQ